MVRNVAPRHVEGMSKGGRHRFIGRHALTHHGARSSFTTCRCSHVQTTSRNEGCRLPPCSSFGREPTTGGDMYGSRPRVSRSPPTSSSSLRWQGLRRESRILLLRSWFVVI